jgi:hypothetical protein
LKAIAVIGVVSLAALACGLFGGPAGKAACDQFKEVVIDWRQGELNTFAFRERLGQVQEKAQAAEPQIKQAADYLNRSANSVSEDRLEVSIDVMSDACIHAGYWERSPL